MPSPLAPVLALLRDGSGRAVVLAFLTNSVVIGSWVARVPEVQERIGLSEGALGLGLLGVPLGSVLAVVLGGRLVDLVGAGRVIVGAGLAFCVAVIGPSAAPSLVALFGACVVFGIGSGFLGVAMNAEAVAVERRLGRRVISACHGSYSVGAAVGAGLGALAARAGISPPLHLGLVALAMGGSVFAARPVYLRLPHERSGDVPPALALPRGPLVGLAVVAAFVLAGESAVADWSAVYLRRSVGTSAAFAGLGYAAFSAAMALGRLFGDPIVERLGAAHTLQYGAALAVVGLGGALLGHPGVALAGFALVGVGLSGAVPALFRTAATAPGTTPGVGIAAVTAVGSIGFVAQPPLVGGLAEWAGLPWALGAVAAVVALAALLAPAAFARAARP